MRIPLNGRSFFGLFPPYREIHVLDSPQEIPRDPLPPRGAAVLWNLKGGDWGRGFRAVRSRPPGVALMVLLPPTEEIQTADRLLDLMEHCRPHSVLPHVEVIDLEELIAVLKRFPGELALEVSEYLSWRGVDVDMDTRRLLRKTLELSETLSTVAGLARALYLSRRALGRRFQSRGLPVPSHWLHFGRILRASLLLQLKERSLFAVACELGYPDGFALSNQMQKLTGLRPSLMRECFGWEWIVEAWLHKEAQAENLSPLLRRSLFPSRPGQVPVASPAGADPAQSPGLPPMRVAEDGSRPRTGDGTQGSS